MPISWQPEIIQFTTSKGKKTDPVQLTFSLPDAEKSQLAIKPFKQYEHLVTINQAARDSFTISLNEPLKKGELPADFSAPFLIFCDEAFDCWGTIPLSIKQPAVAQSSGLKVKESRINLGTIKAGVQLNKHISLKNRGTSPLRLQISPHVDDYSLAAWFIINGPLMQLIEPGQSAKIPFTLWPARDVTTPWHYSQAINITSRQAGNQRLLRVIIDVDIEL